LATARQFLIVFTTSSRLICCAAKRLPLNNTLRYLYSDGILPTVRNYIRLDTMGDASTLEELDPEIRGELESLVENGFLVDIENEFLQ
jgi:hypothetical protein